MAIENISGNESLEELQALLEAMEKRLSILDEKKGLTRPEIYAKVRAEYEAKIAEIQRLMLEKGADLEEALNHAVVDRDTLAFRKQEIKDILDEMELRFVIGEIDEDTKTRQSREYQNELSEIDGKLSTLVKKIENYQRMMAIKPKPSPAPETSKIAPIPKPAAQAIQPVHRQQPEPVAAQPIVQPAVQSPKPVVRTQTEQVAAQPIVKPAAPMPKPQPQVAPEPKAVPDVKSTLQMASRKQTLQPEPSPIPPTAPETVVNEIDELEKQFASLLSESLVNQPQSKPVEVKTPSFTETAQAQVVEETTEESHEGELKCPKCGSYNRADNWYCEKCGNELISAQDLLGK